MEKLRYLILEDGTLFEGSAFGGDEFLVGTIVSNTSMTGYQEILADNSNVGKIITLTYPMIGSYGITREGFENTNPYIFGVVVSEKTNEPSNWKSEMTIDQFLKLKNIPGIEGIDTRMLTKILRDKGEMKAVFADSIENLDEIVEKIKNTEIEKNLPEMVSIKKSFRIPNDGDKVLVIDMGSTDSIVRELNSKNMDITVMPYNFKHEEILSIHPEGVIVSNGPGNANDMCEVVENIKQIIGKVPVFGIGLGHQIVSLALGARLEKLRYSQRGSNYPVKDVESGRVENVTKNNDYSIEENSTKENNLTVTHIDINSGSVDGIKNDEKFVNSVQYQPYGCDKSYEKFYENIEKYKQSNVIAKGEKNA